MSITELRQAVLAIDTTGDLPRQYAELLSLTDSVTRLKWVARDTLQVAEMEYDLWYGERYLEVWDRLEKKFMRSPNISSVEYVVKRDSRTEHLEWRSVLNVHRRSLEEVELLERLLSIKRDVLMSLSADVRAGMRY